MFSLRIISVFQCSALARVKFTYFSSNCTEAPAPKAVAIEFRGLVQQKVKREVERFQYIYHLTQNEQSAQFVLEIN